MIVIQYGYNGYTVARRTRGRAGKSEMNGHVHEYGVVRVRDDGHAGASGEVINGGGSESDRQSKEVPART